MNACSETDLMTEVGRYLAAVEVFRAERCEPTWRPELVPGPAADLRVRPTGTPAVADSQPGAKSSH
jgi:hypothetical protein